MLKWAEDNDFIEMLFDKNIDSLTGYVKEYTMINVGGQVFTRKDFLIYTLKEYKLMKNGNRLLQELEGEETPENT